MVTVRVLRGFWDRIAKTSRLAGTEFEATRHRAEEIAERLPGFVEIVEQEADLESMTVAQLTELAGTLGIEVPKKAKKADLVALLRG